VAQTWEEARGKQGLRLASDSESSLAAGTMSGRRMVLATSLDCRPRGSCGCGMTVHRYCRDVQFFDWMAMAGEARRRAWLDWR